MVRRGGVRPCHRLHQALLHLHLDMLEEVGAGGQLGRTDVRAWRLLIPSRWAHNRRKGVQAQNCVQAAIGRREHVIPAPGSAQIPYQSIYL